ncbi:MAG: hypothetical protein EXQ90_03115 [Rhodospirillales bacterium]|nr:hypothetical protein [Rhodospirillales bacterium]
MQIDSEVYRVAGRVMDDERDNALSFTLAKIESLYRDGDRKGCLFWLKVAQVLGEFLSDEPPARSTAH